MSQVCKLPVANEKCRTESDDRGHWTNRFGFFLSCLGYASGLGNIWRFPYLCYRNGGGAFLVPYVLMLMLCGLPMFFLELSLGQYHGKGPNIIFKRLAPILHGLGYAMLVVSTLVSIYYNIVIAWAIFYFVESMTVQLKWEFCGNEWNSPGCFNAEQNRECERMNLTYWNNTCFEVEPFCLSFPDMGYLNATHCLDQNGGPLPASAATRRTAPSEDYYLHYMLRSSSGLDKCGDLQWNLVLCLLAAWAIVAACLIKGIKSSGKVVYFTAIFPYVVLLILLVRGVTLEGAADGIYFYIIPKWEKLTQFQAWNDAAVQILYSFGPGFGGLLTLASYNRFNNDCHRDAVIVGLLNFLTGVLAGFAVFSILGFMAYTLKVPVENVVQSGPGLAFIAYPEAVTKMPLSPLWSFLFFFMLITLGLDSQLAMCGTVVTAIHDQWPQSRRRGSVVVIITCATLFLLGLSLCTQCGIYLFTIIDVYAAGWSLLVIALLEIILISWIYGVEKYKRNVAEMVGKAPNFYWSISWKYLCPCGLLGLLVSSLGSFSPPRFGSYELPMWANVGGWLMAFSSVLMIPIFAGYEIRKKVKKGKVWSSLFLPTKDWRPANTLAEETKDKISNHDFPSSSKCTITSDYNACREAYRNPAFTVCEDIEISTHI